MSNRARDSFLICTIRGHRPGSVLEAYAADGHTSRDHFRWQYFACGMDAHDWAREHGIQIKGGEAVILPHFRDVVTDGRAGARLLC